jgi:hypothetical protein
VIESGRPKCFDADVTPERLATFSCLNPADSVLQIQAAIVRAPATAAS